MNRPIRFGCAGIAVGLLCALAPADPKADEMLPGWGKPIDPDGDCKIALDDGKLTFEVPGSWHALFIEGGKMNAPRVLRPADGEFIVQVKVTGRFRPGPVCLRDGGIPFNGSGLVLWQDEKNYLRLERAAVLDADGLSPYILYELRKNGERVLSTGIGCQDQDASLRLEVRERKIFASVSFDDETWQALEPIESPFEDRMQIGVSAGNSSNEPFKPQLEKFVVFRKQLDPGH